jgi:hypothetical protein
LRALIVYRTVEPVSDMPVIFSTGSYTLVDSYGRKFDLDFEESATSCTKDTYGHYVFESVQKVIDTEYVDTSNNGVIMSDDITPELLAKCKLVEAFYECFADDEEKEHIPLVVVSFHFYNWEIPDSEVQISLDGFINQ